MIVFLLFLKEKNRKTMMHDEAMDRTFRFALALDAGHPVARAHQNAAQVRPFPLVVDGVVLAVL